MSITSNGQYRTYDGQDHGRPAVAGDHPIFIHRKNQSLIDKVLAIKDAAERAAAEAKAEPVANYYHS